MAEIMLIAKLVASTASLLILRPKRAKRKALGALRELDSAESVSLYVDENPTKTEPSQST